MVSITARTGGKALFRRVARGPVRCLSRERTRLRCRPGLQCRRPLGTLLGQRGFQQWFWCGRIRKNGVGREELDCRSWRSLSAGAPGRHMARLCGVLVRGFSVDVSTSFVATEAIMLLLRRGFIVPRLTLMDSGETCTVRILRIRRRKLRTRGSA